MLGRSGRANFRADRTGRLRWRRNWGDAGRQCAIAGGDARNAGKCADGKSVRDDDTAGDAICGWSERRNQEARAAVERAAAWLARGVYISRKAAAQWRRV